MEMKLRQKIDNNKNSRSADPCQDESGQDPDSASQVQHRVTLFIVRCA